MAEWKRTGKPAHNKGEAVSEEDAPRYEANPTCPVCAGSGEITMERPLRNHEGECVDVEFYNHPCDCIFYKWERKPDPKCTQCCGVGVLQERLLHEGEEVVFLHDCPCLRYISEGEKDD
ncbi:hypothetical protein [Phenylobacterium sp.]|uniref:hypothetical protein n=1 Tax=Phenylobacterium sp. TaxID=1871053 RepID=UPI0025F8FE68|nr:hypothetical protein [Phenylobacterium sp.]